MGAQTSAILKGFDYQHLISWYHVLSLINKNEIIKIKLENSEAGHVDDLTVYKQNGAVDFYQVKYHVNVGSYSIDSLLDSTNGTSLMEKFWVTWQKLKKHYSKDKIRLILYSNWVHHPEDKILTCISGTDGSLDETFFKATDKSACGKEREKWKKKHAATDQDFLDFTKVISFHFGRNFTEELKEQISNKMWLFGLKHDVNALIIAAGIIKDWIETKVEEITPALLEEKIKQHDLYLPMTAEKAAAIYFITVKDRQFDLTPDYILDWRKYFKQIADRRDHELINSGDWNNTMFPELIELENKVNTETGARLIRARGYSRLSPWFAFGHTFSEVGGYVIEVNQQTNYWRTDINPNPDFELISDNINGEKLPGSNKTVAVGISITGSLENDVKKYLAENEKAGSLLLLKPKNGIGNSAITDGSDIKAFALQAKEKIRNFVKANNAERLLLFYFGPLSGACFLGHQLNAVCKEIQIMENTSNNSYIPSFLLK